MRLGSLGQHCHARFVNHRCVAMPTTNPSLDVGTCILFTCVARPDIHIPAAKKIMAPANLRAQADNAGEQGGPGWCARRGLLPRHSAWLTGPPPACLHPNPLPFLACPPCFPCLALPCPAAYRELVLHWLEERYTLRYSGGLVPDLHHILSKVRLAGATVWGAGGRAAGWPCGCLLGCWEAATSLWQQQLCAPVPSTPAQGGGVFCSPTSASAPPKLRCLYETFPLALLIEAAGGSSHDGRGSVLDQDLLSHDQRGALCLGSAAEVAKCLPAMQAGP